MNEYGTKVVQSGKIVEVYEYKNPIKSGFGGGKGGRRKSSDIVVAEKEENREKVLSRARRDLRRIVNSNIQTYSKFLTLTFADNVQDIGWANREFSKFVMRLNYHLGYKVAYSGVIEFQKRGAIHYHVIFYNTPQKLKLSYLRDIWGFGHIKINVIKNIENVGAYVCKYMSKCENEEKLRGKKMYFNSRGLKKPIEIKEPALVFSLVGQLQGQAPVYENTFVNDYNTVSYKQYNIE